VVTREWADRDYPKIKKLAQQSEADIYFEDEAGTRSDYHLGTTWAVRSTSVKRFA
jgi:hypothetical protein